MTRRLRIAGIAIASGVGYFAAGRLGLALLTDAESVAVFWPASGIAAGALLAFGRDARVPILLAVTLASIVASLTAGRNFPSALVFGLCNSGEAILAAWLIERRFGCTFRLDSVRQIIGLMLFSALACGMAAAVATVAMKIFGPSTAPMLNIWQVWFTSDVLGIVLVAPLLITSASYLRREEQRGSLNEGVLALVVTAGASILGFGQAADSWVTVFPVALVLPLLVWSAARCPPVFAAAAVFIVACAIVGSLTFGVGRLGDQSLALGDRVRAAQAALLALSVCTLTLAALFAERRRHEKALATSEARLRSILDATKVVAWEAETPRDDANQLGPLSDFLDEPGDPGSASKGPFAAAIHPADINRVSAELGAAIRGDAPYRTEFRILLSDGNVRWLACRAR